MARLRPVTQQQESPQPQIERRRRRRTESGASPRLAHGMWQGILFGVLCALLVRGALALGWLQGVDQDALDTLFRFRGARYPHPDIILVVADDSTVASARQWPLPRKLYADVIEKLHDSGARTIALDVLFSTPSLDKKNDRQLVEASRLANNVIQAAAFFVPTSYNPELPASTLANSFPLPARFRLSDRDARSRTSTWVSSTFPALSKSAPALGHLNVHPEPDGALRRIPHVLRYKDGLYPSLALASAAHYLGLEPFDVVAEGDEIVCAGRRIPVDNDGETWINWAGGNGTFPTFTFNEVLSDRVGAEQLKGRVVLVGVTAAGAFEHRATPFSPVQPAIELQANALNDILQDRLLHVAPEGTRELLLLLFGVLSGIMIASRRALSGTVWLVSFLLVAWAAAAVIFARFDLYLPVAAPILVSVLTYGAVLIWKYRRVWEDNWRADASVATLARGGALLASGRDRGNLHRVILETAREALDAHKVLLATPDDPNPVLRDVARSVLARQQTVLWPLPAASSLASHPNPLRAGPPTSFSATRTGTSAGRVVFEPAYSMSRSSGSFPAAPAKNAKADASRAALDAVFELLCAQVAEGDEGSVASDTKAPVSGPRLSNRAFQNARLRTVVAVPLLRGIESSAHPSRQKGATTLDMDARSTHGVLIAVGRCDNREFAARDAVLLETLAEQATLALENLEYYEQLSGRVELANRELSEAYQLLSEQSVKMLAAVESIDDALIVTNEHGHAVYINAASRTLLREATPAVGDSVPQVLRAHGLGELADFFNVLSTVTRRTLIIDPQELAREHATRASKIQREISPVLTHPETPGANGNGAASSRGGDTAPIWSAQFTPLLGDHGRVLGALLVVADVTVQRELDAMKSDFVGFVAHELRTPLTTILGYSSLLQGAGDKIPEGQRVDMMGAIIHHCKRLNRMISELLDVSKLEAGHSLFLRRELVDIAGMAERACDEQRASSSRSDMEIRFVAALRPLMARLDSDRIEQVLGNLVSNAVKYSPDGGVVTVEVQDAGEDVVIYVRDTGMGMTQEQQAQLFQKFYRTKDAQIRGIKGTGLGLFLVKQLVEAHDGTINVQSTFGEGTTFSVTLPKAPAETPTADQFALSHASPNTPHQSIV
ncbi:MAG: two-component system, OmpR family, phosphate regulon sensor histidine kinase PhoR [Abditibacteriota bacterium]|nr:two-component system, OmpR family, phosphate regulon sensor histidine kinase PhoR [Abditibacteriota bacterium]